MEAVGVTRTVVVDDHEATREGVVRVLRREGFEIAGTASDAAEGEALILREDPDLCVIDVILPGASGTELVRGLLARKPELGVVMYTGTESGAMLTEVLECGARGMVLKRSPLDQLVAAARAVVAGGAYVDPELHSLLLSRETTGTIRDLSAREREVLDLLSKGLKGVEIAEELGVSPETIRTHIQNAMNKLEARTRAHAVAIVLRQGEASRWG